LAAADFGRRFGQRDLLAFDMGGTTAKACLIRDGKPNVTDLLVVGADNNRPGVLGARVAGLPVRAVSVDLVECSAGGGSIAWVDVAGILKVGPGSAGASPGPVCYGVGGTEPTVTDAHAVLGHLSPDALLGGRMRIDAEAARRAIQDRVATKLGVDVHAAAQGIIDIANANMLRILRVVSVARGFDPRDFALIPFGGGGPLHAGDLANELGLAQIVVPPNPGVFSAVGLVMSEIHSGFSRTVLLRAVSESLPAINHWFEQFVAQCHAALERERVPASAWRVAKFLDMRYAKQNFELEIPVEGPLQSQADLDALIATFHATHTHTYGHCDPDAPVEIVSVKTRASGEAPPVRFRPIPQGNEDPREAYSGSRPAYMGHLGRVDTPRYERSKLKAGNVLKGPAIVDSFDSTCLILPGHIATVGALGELVIRTR
jgi:N-methylhydantoinase A